MALLLVTLRMKPFSVFCLIFFTCVSFANTRPFGDVDDRERLSAAIQAIENAFPSRPRLGRALVHATSHYWISGRGQNVLILTPDLDVTPRKIVEDYARVTGGVGMVFDPETEIREALNGVEHFRDRPGRIARGWRNLSERVVAFAREKRDGTPTLNVGFNLAPSTLGRPDDMHSLISHLYEWMREEIVPGSDPLLARRHINLFIFADERLLTGERLKPDQDGLRELLAKASLPRAFLARFTDVVAADDCAFILSH